MYPQSREIDGLKIIYCINHLGYCLIPLPHIYCTSTNVAVAILLDNKLNLMVFICVP